MDTIDALGSHVAAHGVFVYEDGSTDATRMALQAWVGARPHAQAFFGRGIIGPNSRTERLALCNADGRSPAAGRGVQLANVGLK